MLRSILPEGRRTISHWAYVLGPARYYQPAYQHIAAAIDLREGAFLDVGCGPGWLSIRMAAGKPELDCVGIDRSEFMLGQARANAGPRLNVSFRHMEAHDIKYPQDTFHAAAAVQSAHHWSDTPAILAEVHRVLVPGARFYIYEADSDATEVPRGWIRRSGPWPPDALLRRNWRRFGMSAARWEDLKKTVRSSPFGGGQDGHHGFYRRLVLTR